MKIKDDMFIIKHPIISAILGCKIVRERYDSYDSVALYERPVIMAVYIIFLFFHFNIMTALSARMITDNDVLYLVELTYYNYVVLGLIIIFMILSGLVVKENKHNFIRIGGLASFLIFLQLCLVYPLHTNYMQYLDFKSTYNIKTSDEIYIVELFYKVKHMQEEYQKNIDIQNANKVLNNIRENLKKNELDEIMP